ncbi:helix-turn-helix domain-containing protein [Collimonas sp. NPDC087041]|uniref:helix-turn-helix domain-containing protein n=1 Tax=Collimonas sp. NPDC087041 TaxID=3363960 RepID=UPI0037F3428C
MSGFYSTPCSAMAPGVTIPRHVHVQAYATIVLDGGYQEAGDGGRWDVRSGDVLLHAPFSAHWDLVTPRGARVLNLPLLAPIQLSACGQVGDLDLVIRLTMRDQVEAAAVLMQNWRQTQNALNDAPDLMAHAMSDADPFGVQSWASANGVSRVTAFRCFRSAYGVEPTRYRVEARARAAWQMIVSSKLSLAEVAAAAGYADQAHMSRDVKAFTGRSPGVWRSGDGLKHSFKTEMHQY